MILPSDLHAYEAAMLLIREAARKGSTVTLAPQECTAIVRVTEHRASEAGRQYGS